MLSSRRQSTGLATNPPLHCVAGNVVWNVSNTDPHDIRRHVRRRFGRSVGLSEVSRGRSCQRFLQNQLCPSRARASSQHCRRREANESSHRTESPWPSEWQFYSRVGAAQNWVSSSTAHHEVEYRFPLHATVNAPYYARAHSNSPFLFCVLPSFLTIKDAAALATCCTRLARVFEERNVWFNFCRRDFHEDAEHKLDELKTAARHGAPAAGYACDWKQLYREWHLSSIRDRNHERELQAVRSEHRCRCLRCNAVTVIVVCPCIAEHTRHVASTDGRNFQIAEFLIN